MPMSSKTTVSAFRQIADGLRLQEAWSPSFPQEWGIVFHQRDVVIWMVEHVRPALISLRG